jgi:rare lipoprotein A
MLKYTSMRFDYFLKIFCEIFSLMLLLSGCAPEEEMRIKKYWHAGTERPYEINGRFYYPQTHYRYRAVGYASWYGSECHGQKTATGRVFSKDKITAAHRTLPLPCVVIVENLSNGRRVKFLVNDRGPFAQVPRRIIDVSERGAKLLGFFNKGTEKVMVMCLPLESQCMALEYKRKPYPSKPYVR